jgi:hypothetical protein
MKLVRARLREDVSSKAVTGATKWRGPLFAVTRLLSHDGGNLAYSVRFAEYRTRHHRATATMLSVLINRGAPGASSAYGFLADAASTGVQ